MGRAQALLGEFALDASLNNNVSGGPALVSLGGQITPLGYVFSANQGLTFASPALNPASYSIELSFKSNLDTASTWSKLVDINGLSSDNGLYIHNSGGFRLQFYPQSDATVADFSAGTNVNVVLTREGTTGVVTGYVNGEFRFSFNDTGNIGVVTAASNTLTFFVDDFSTGQGEASSGTVKYLRIYNGALTAGQVSALFANGAPTVVPEPAAVWLIALGAVGLLAARRRCVGPPRDGRPA